MGVLAEIPLDHGIPPVETRGGSAAAQALLRNFLRKWATDLRRGRKFRRKTLHRYNCSERGETSGITVLFPSRERGRELWEMIVG